MRQQLHDDFEARLHGSSWLLVPLTGGATTFLKEKTVGCEWFAGSVIVPAHEIVGTVAVLVLAGFKVR